MASPLTNETSAPLRKDSTIENGNTATAFRLPNRVTHCSPVVKSSHPLVTRAASFKIDETLLVPVLPRVNNSEPLRFEYSSSSFSFSELVASK